MTGHLGPLLPGGRIPDPHRLIVPPRHHRPAVPADRDGQHRAAGIEPTECIEGRKPPLAQHAVVMQAPRPPSFRIDSQGPDGNAGLNRLMRHKLLAGGNRGRRPRRTKDLERRAPGSDRCRRRHELAAIATPAEGRRRRAEGDLLEALPTIRFPDPDPPRAIPHGQPLAIGAGREHDRQGQALRDPARRIVAGEIGHLHAPVGAGHHHLAADAGQGRDRPGANPQRAEGAPLHLPHGPVGRSRNDREIVGQPSHPAASGRMAGKGLEGGVGGQRPVLNDPRLGERRELAAVGRDRQGHQWHRVAEDPRLGYRADRPDPHRAVRTRCRDRWGLRYPGQFADRHRPGVEARLGHPIGRPHSNDAPVLPRAIQLRAVGGERQRRDRGRRDDQRSHPTARFEDPLRLSAEGDPIPPQGASPPRPRAGGAGRKGDQRREGKGHRLDDHPAGRIDGPQPRQAVGHENLW